MKRRLRRGLCLALAVATVPATALGGPGTATAQAGKVELFQVNAPTGEGGGIAAGPDGNVWFTEGRGKKVGRITPDGQVAEFPLPFTDGWPRRIAASPDGNVWFTVEGVTNSASDRVARIDTSGNVTELVAAAGKSSLGGIAAGSDGAIWFTERLANEVDRVTSDGQIAEFPVPTPGSGPSEIVGGADGNLWFVETAANRVARIAPSGAIAEFALPPSKEGPRDIAASPDGNLWLTEFGRNALARVRTDGQVTEFRIPAAASGGPRSIAADTHGNLWFSGRSDTIMRMTPAGGVAEFAIPYKRKPCGQGPCGAAISPADLAAGPDGNIWFIASGGPSGISIGRIEPDAPPPIPSASVRPSLHGRTAAGQRITARVGSWSNAPTEYAFRWQECDRRGRNCSALRGRGESIVLTRTEIGHTVRAVVAASNDAGSVFLTTAPTAVVRTAPAPLRVEIESTRAHVGRGGEAKLRLSCVDGPPGGYCSGTVLLGLSRERRGGLGRTRYRLATGNRKRISVPLEQSARALLARAPRHRLDALVTVTLWGGRAASRVLTLAG